MTTLTRDTVARDLIASGNLLRREILIRATTTPREFDGIGVPWDELIEHWFGEEQFDRGSVELAQPCIVCWRHNEPIGLITAGADTDTGFAVTGRLSRTRQGDEAATLLDDGVITRMSIGFEPIEYRVDENDVIHWTRVIAREFSLTPFAAYDGATITTIRQPASPTTTKETTMPPVADTLTREDLNPINITLDELKRDVARIATHGQPAGHVDVHWRSMGDFLRAIAAKDERALEFHRAYTGGEIADAALGDTFIGDFIKLVQHRRRYVAMFTTGTLPARGNSIDYRQLAGNTITVDAQASEGADLPGGGKITLVRANAPVNTDGGWFQLSLQEILRGSGTELTTSWEAAAIAYAKHTDNRVKAALTELIADRILAMGDPDGQPNALTLPAAATTDQWLDLLVDGVETFDERGFALHGLAVSKAKFKQLAKLKDGDRRLMNVFGAGVNQVGEINIPRLEGDIARIPVTMLTNVSDDTATFYDPVAIKFLESAGAPAQLQDESIINLTKAFSLYGFNAIINPFPSAVLPIKFTA